MKLAEQIEVYKSKHGKGDHTFKNGVKVQRLHYWLDMVYSDAVKEFKMYGTKNNANYLLFLLRIK
jgi:hypothetical protein